MQYQFLTYREPYRRRPICYNPLHLQPKGYPGNWIVYLYHRKYKQLAHAEGVLQVLSFVTVHATDGITTDITTLCLPHDKVGLRWTYLKVMDTPRTDL